MFVPEQKNETKGIYMFGKDNLLPNKLMKWVLDSGTAKRAVSKRAAYIAADGFIDETAANYQVNPKQTADKLVTEIAGYQSYFKGFALHVKRTPNTEGLPDVQVTVLPFQDIRKRLDGRYDYNPTFSAAKFNANDNKIIEPYKKDRKIDDSEAGKLELAKIKDNGELIYAYHKNADNPNYPIPDYYAGIEDIRTSSELQKFDFESVTNAFLPSAILTIIGEVDNQNQDEAGRTEQDYLDESLEQFTGNVKDAEGKAGRMRLMVMNARSKDEVPVLQTFDAKAIIDASNSKREVIDRAVCRLFGVPPVICGFADAAVLGNQQAMANASQELNNDVISDQQLITETMAALYPEIQNWDLSTFRPIQFIPDAVIQKLSDDEVRAIGGYAPAKEGEAKALADTIGESKTNSIISLLSNGSLSVEQKQNTLQILFGLTSEDANRLVAGATQPINQPAA